MRERFGSVVQAGGLASVCVMLRLWREGGPDCAKSNLEPSRVTVGRSTGSCLRLEGGGLLLEPSFKGNGFTKYRVLSLKRAALETKGGSWGSSALTI